MKATPKPGSPVGFARTFPRAPDSGFHREQILWTSGDDFARAVEIVITPDWKVSDTAPTEWQRRTLTYVLQWSEGILYTNYPDELNASSDVDSVGARPPLAVPANGVRYRLTARSVDLIVRTGIPDFLAFDLPVRVSICPVDSVVQPCPIPPVDIAYLGGESPEPQQRRFPIGAREWRLWPTALDLLDEYPDFPIHVYRPDGGTIAQSIPYVELVDDWVPIPFDGYWWGAPATGEWLGFGEENVTVRYR